MKSNKTAGAAKTTTLSIARDIELAATTTKSAFVAVGACFNKV